MADKVKEVAEEQPPSPTNVTADPVGGVANESTDEEAKLISLNSPFSDDNLRVPGSVLVENVAAIDQKTVVVSEVETISVSTTSVAMMEIFTGVGKIDEQGKLPRVAEEREEVEEKERGSSVQVIELEYDGSQEEIELDLDKFYGHIPHCPKCSHQITKVILRRKHIVREPSVYDKMWGYCIKCVKVVRTTVSWHTIRQVVTKMIDATHERVKDEKDSIPKPADDRITKPGDGTEEGSTNTTIKLSNDINPPEISKKTNKDGGGKVERGSTNTAVISPNDNNLQLENLPEKKIEEVKIDDGEGKPVPRDYEDVTVPDGEIKQGSTVITIDNTKLHEILKCIVYGGLIESITSLSIVASVAATDATTLNVLAIGLALLFSGLIAFCFNLVDLKNDAYSIKKYRELLGWKKDDFRLHATCAILSYVVFGLITPTTYALAFHESDNKEHKIIVAVVAAFACIFLLAMAKAYVSREKDKLPRYVETTRYYLIIAFSVSGVAYAVGYMIEMLMLGLGLFRSVRRVTCYVPDQRISATPTWTSY